MPGARRENWATGLRNPWRYAFDPPSGLLYIGDVGQAQHEELNVVPAASAGLNYGWSIMEGSARFNAPTCTTTGLTMPLLDYDHTVGCAIAAGYVYRGKQVPALNGIYVYGDFCAPAIHGVVQQGGRVVEQRNIASLGSLTTFGEDKTGELYAASREGTVYRFTAG